MRSSIITFIQFYIIISVFFLIIYLDFFVFGGVNLSTYLRYFGYLIFVFIISKIKFIKFSEKEIIIYDVFFRKTHVLYQEIESLSRFYSQICYLRRKNGSKIFFLQRFYHSLLDLFLSEKNQNRLLELEKFIRNKQR